MHCCRACASGSHIASMSWHSHLDGPSGIHDIDGLATLSLLPGRLGSVTLRGRWHRRWAGSAARERRVGELMLPFLACPLEVAASNDVLVEPRRHPPTEPDDPRSLPSTRSGWQSRQALPLAKTRCRLLRLCSLGGITDVAVGGPGAYHRRRAGKGAGRT